MTMHSYLQEHDNLKLYNVGEQDERPWGSYEVLNLGMTQNNEEFCEKRIVVKPKQALSLQRHQMRHEMWAVKAGMLTAIVDSKIYRINAGDNIIIPLHSVHCMINSTNEEVVIFERQIGVCREEDNERLCDLSGRETSVIDPADRNALKSKELYEKLTQNLK